ncbi:hypothetical protein GCM10008967_27260 [Bacillus carboniphilus]|uniref:ABC transporter domain-containing protein n=1 Tax=Bacillus carboniphilus TaxID=86663 RepID=A0ABP3G7V5_9BACI
MFIQLDQLQYQYKNAKHLTIKDFSLSIEKGEIVSILGKSGSGKSTILRLITGLEAPKKGSITIDGKVMVDETHYLPPEKRGIGMVFQDYALFPHMTVEKNISFGLNKMSRSLRKQRIDEMLALINLSEFKKRYPYELSGGQQQRVALARALAPAPSLLVFDEPFSNLDSQLQMRIREELRAIIKQTGITSIFVTHDIEDARSLSDRIVFIEDGKIAKISQTCPSDYLQHSTIY